MDKIIHLGIPHVGEQIFETFDTQELIKWLKMWELIKKLKHNAAL